MFDFLMWIPMFFSIVLFYLNYSMLVDRLLFNKKIILFLVINLLLIVVFSYSSDLLRNLLWYSPADRISPMPKPPKGLLFGLHNFPFLFIVSISVAIKTTSRWYTSENQRKNLENENLKSELNNLKMQLNPHFFFNTLNNIYSLIQISPEKAQESVHGLAKLMRYHLYETNEDRVALTSEVEFLKSYIALMEIRLSSSAEVETSFSIENKETTIAPILFIPLVENAFKHGINPNEKSVIKISLKESEHIVSFETLNTNFPQKYQTDKEAYGIGLENFQKRLSLIYPGKFIFIKDFIDNLFHVKVVIQP